MPYEFNCRYCNARIRVADNAGGGKGRCPKCSIRITVPKKSSKPTTSRSNVSGDLIILPWAQQGPIAPEVGASEAITETEVVQEALVNSEPEPIVFKSIDDPLLPSESVPTIEEISYETPVARSPKKPPHRRSKATKLGQKPKIIAAMIGLALIAVVVALTLIPFLTTERLVGELTAETAETLELSAVLIEKSRINISTDELESLLKKLEASPVPMTSYTSQIELKGSTKGLLASVAAGSQAHFYRVSVKNNEQVQKYLSSHETELDAIRNKEVDKSVSEFFVNYQNVLSKKMTADKLSSFRDTLAIPALVRGFGHQIVAAHGRGLYRCVYEDRDGGLYFLLPADVKKFELHGREGANGATIVAAELKVKVIGELSVPKKLDTGSNSKNDEKSDEEIKNGKK